MQTTASNALTLPPGALPRFEAIRAEGGLLRITCFGSSTTEGYGASGPDHAYPEVMRRRLLPAFPGGILLANLGISGESALEMDGRVDEVIHSRPDLVIWQTGSNDVTRPVPVEQFETLTRDGLTRMRAAGADVALMEQQYCTALEERDTFAGYVDALHRVAAAFGVPVFPRYALMRDWCSDGRFTVETLSPDGTHMDDAGYRLLGDAVAEWLMGEG